MYETSDETICCQERMGNTRHFIIVDCVSAPTFYAVRLRGSFTARIEDWRMGGISMKLLRLNRESLAAVAAITP